MIGSVVSEGFYHIYSSTTTSITCLSNILLIYVLTITHISQIGPYRILLLIFAVTDVLVSLIHLMFIPAVHMTEFGYIFWGYRFLSASTTVGTWAGLIMVILFYQTFVLLAFHYVFRYVKLCNPVWLSWIGQKPWRNWLVIGIVSDIVFVGSIFLACFYGYVPTELSRKAYAPVIKEVYGIDLFAANEPGYLGIVYWIRTDGGEKEWSLFALFIICCVIIPFSASGAIIVLSTVKIVRELSAGRFVAQASATKRLQQQLFKTLIVQTIVPCITAYVPLGMIFLVPLTGFPMEGLGTVCMMSAALFPMLDPFIVVFLITGYRKAQLRLIKGIWAYIVANVACGNSLSALGKWARRTTVAAIERKPVTVTAQ